MQSRLESVSDFLKRGGKITKCAGFTGVVPMPDYRPPKRKKAKVKYEPILRVEPNENQVDREFIAAGAGFSSVTSLRAKSYAVFMPNPLKARGPGGRHLYDKAEALKAIEQIKSVRSGFVPATKDVDAAMYKYASYAKKQRNKRELREEWTV